MLDGLGVKTRFHVRDRNGLARPVLLLFFLPGLVCQPVHLVQEIAGGGIEHLHLADLHETPAKEHPASVHHIGIREIGKTREEGGDVRPLRVNGRGQHLAQVGGEHFLDRTVGITESGGSRAVVKAVPEDIIVENQLVVESIHSQHIGALLPHPSFPAILPVEVFGIRHPGTAGELGRLPGKGIQMDMVGHLGIRQDFRLGPESLNGQDVDEHPVVRFVAEHHLVVRGKTNAVRLFDVAKQRKKNRETLKTTH